MNNYNWTCEICYHDITNTFTTGMNSLKTYAVKSFRTLKCYRSTESIFNIAL